jgi:vacuolar-type H+-ATPase subunit I/STV1
MSNITDQIGGLAANVWNTATSFMSPTSNETDVETEKQVENASTDSTTVHTEEPTRSPLKTVLDSFGEVTTGRLSDAIQRVQQYGRETNNSAQNTVVEETPAQDVDQVATDVNKAEDTQKIKSIESLNEALEFLRLHSIPLLEALITSNKDKIDKTRQSITTLDTFLNKVDNARTNEGGVNFTQSEDLKALSEEIQQLGVDLPQKAELSKDERDSLVRAVNNKRDQIETDIKLLVQEGQKLMQQRDAIWQEIKSAWDSIKSTVSRIIQNINTRTS